MSFAFMVKLTKNKGGFVVSNCCFQVKGKTIMIMNYDSSFENGIS